MTWSEFQIRLFAYKRMELAEFEKMREMMWITYIAPHLNHKKMAKSKKALFPLPSDKSRKGISAEHKEMFIKSYLEWQSKSKQLSEPTYRN